MVSFWFSGELCPESSGGSVLGQHQELSDKATENPKKPPRNHQETTKKPPRNHQETTKKPPGRKSPKKKGNKKHQELVYWRVFGSFLWFPGDFLVVS